MKLAYCFGLLAILGVNALVGQTLTEPNSPLLDSLFEKASDPFKTVLYQPELYKYQVVFSRIDRSGRTPKITHHYYNFDKSQYLYPASFAKIPTSILAFQKMETYRKTGINVFTPMVTDSAYECQTSVYYDETQPLGRPSIDGYVKKMMLVSDNDAYNRTYEFVGYDYFYDELAKRGMEKTRIVQRFEYPCDSLGYYITNPVRFLDSAGKTIFEQPLGVGRHRLRNPYGEVWMGSSYYNEDYLYPFPRSFLLNNFVPLDELQRMMQIFYIPESVPSSQRFNLSGDNANRLKRYMGMWPRESTYPKYDLPDNFKKYILMGNGAPLPQGSDIRIFNHIARAYGVIGDCAYVVDFNNNVEFMVSCIMYCNENDILNDDTYEYEIGVNFMSELGRILYNYELNDPSTKLKSNLPLLPLKALYLKK